jgi:pimeloyl-ACP methyl ester carboxylesterase
LLESTSATTTYHRMTIDGVGVFYREAGPKDAPTIVLLHGFPSSSREFDTLARRIRAARMSSSSMPFIMRNLEEQSGPSRDDTLRSRPRRRANFPAA